MRTILIWLVLTVLTSAHAFAGDNVCRLDSVQWYGENHFSVLVSVDNSDTIAGFQIPLTFNFGQSAVTYDSVSFGAGRCAAFPILDSERDTTSMLVYLSGVYNSIDNPEVAPLMPGQGEIAKIYFSITGVPDSSNVAIQQSSYYLENNQLDYLFWGPNADEVNCRFEISPFSLLH